MNTAAYIYGVRDVRIEAFTPPKNPDDRVPLQVASVGICGSDLHYYKDGAIGGAVINEPFVPGHEFSARAGRDVESLGILKGELVAVDPAIPCNACEWCHGGHRNLCPYVEFMGAPPFHGALTQQIAVPEACIIKLPEGMSADEGAMLEPLGVCIHAIDLAKPQLLENVAVLGCGAIGLGIVQLLKLSTAGKVIAVDPQSHRARAAAALGATSTGLSVDAVLDETNGLGCDLVIEATNSPAAFNDAIRACKIGGRMVLAGIPDGNFYDPLSAADARRRGLSLKFSRRMGEVYPRAIELVSSGKVDVMSLVSHHFELADTANAFKMQDEQAEDLIKSIILIGHDSLSKLSK